MFSDELVNDSAWLVEQVLETASVDEDGFEGTYVPRGVELLEDRSRLAAQQAQSRGNIEADLKVVDPEADERLRKAMMGE